MVFEYQLKARQISALTYTVQIIDFGGSQVWQLQTMTNHLLSKYQPKTKNKRLGLSQAKNDVWRIHLGSFPGVITPNYVKIIELSTESKRINALDWAIEKKAIFGRIHLRIGTLNYVCMSKDLYHKYLLISKQIISFVVTDELIYFVLVQLCLRYPVIGTYRSLLWVVLRNERILRDIRNLITVSLFSLFFVCLLYIYRCFAVLKIN